MSSLPYLHFKQRAPRMRLADMTPAVLRFEDGQRTAGKLQVLSVTGGLLSLTTPLDQGSRVKLMFLTSSGPVLGGAEMLHPISSTLQPFRFVSLPVEDHRRLGCAIQSFLGQTLAEPEWMEKLRTAAYGSRPRRRTFRFVLCAAAIGGAIGSVLYLLQLHVLK
jgi:hypothetical protein